MTRYAWHVTIFFLFYFYLFYFFFTYTDIYRLLIKDVLSQCMTWLQVAPILYRFEAAEDEDGIRRPLGEVKKEARDDPECKAITEALKYVAKIDEIDIVNMSVGSAKKPPGIEEVLPKLAINKILIASAGELYQFSILLQPTQPMIVWKQATWKPCHMKMYTLLVHPMSYVSQSHYRVASLTAVCNETSHWNTV